MSKKLKNIYNLFDKAWIMSMGEPTFMEELEKTKKHNYFT